MTTKFVIDTNVAIVANGKCDHASFSCQLACIEQLENCKTLHIVIDDVGLIITEYAKHLSYAGQPGVGDAFFKYLFYHQYTTENIHRVKITPTNEEKTEFAELPENKLDPSDRKFLATAVVAQANIVNAVDIDDWQQQQALLEALQIEVKQLCPEHSCK